MTEKQWDILLRVVSGEKIDPLPVGFIIDSPWVPGWSGISKREYFCSDSAWLATNLKACDTFPEIIFIPGFWSEYGMCTEPSAFGAKCSWPVEELPHAARIVTTPADAAKVEKPDVENDGMLPFMIERLRQTQPIIEEHGHSIKFAVTRGPLNIASFLMGTTELMMGFYTDREDCEKFLNTITEFVIDWIALQKKHFPSIDAILMLDDIVGFVGDDDYMAFAHPYLKRIYDSCDFSVKAFHNDAPGLVCAPHLADLGVNLFNFGFEHGIDEMRELCGPSVALLGNLPPRDVLAGKPADEVCVEARKMVEGVKSRDGVLFSCGGGMPQNVSTEQIEAFCAGVLGGA